MTFLSTDILPNEYMERTILLTDLKFCWKIWE